MMLRNSKKNLTNKTGEKFFSRATKDFIFSKKINHILRTYLWQSLDGHFTKKRQQRNEDKTFFKNADAREKPKLR